MSKKNMGEAMNPVLKKYFGSTKWSLPDEIAQALRDEGFIHRDAMREVVEAYHALQDTTVCENEGCHEVEMWAAIKAVAERVK